MENKEGELQEELNGLIQKETSVEDNKREDKFNFEEDESLEIKGNEMYSEDVTITENVSSKLTLFMTKFGMGYGTAKMILWLVAIVFFAISGYLFNNYFNKTNNPGVSGTSGIPDFQEILKQ